MLCVFNLSVYWQYSGLVIHNNQTEQHPLSICLTKQIWKSYRALDQIYLMKNGRRNKKVYGLWNTGYWHDMVNFMICISRYKAVLASSLHLKDICRTSLVWSVTKILWCSTLFDGSTELDQYWTWFGDDHCPGCDWGSLSPLWISDCKFTMALDQIKEEQKAHDAQSCRNTSNVVYWIFFETLWEPIKLS